jgi:hypothetical protein
VIQELAKKYKQPHSFRQIFLYFYFVAAALHGKMVAFLFYIICLAFINQRFCSPEAKSFMMAYEIGP